VSAKKNPYAVGLGKLGGKARKQALTPEQISEISRKAGKVGGKARAQSLTPEERVSIAKKAAAKRWAKKKGTKAKAEK
jgi:hypothetical protein